MFLTLVWLCAFGGGPMRVQDAGAAIRDTAARETYRVPFRLSETKHLLVRAKINGKGPFLFLVDTGAPAVYVAGDTAKQIGLTAGKNGWANVARLEVEGGASVENLPVRMDDPTQLKGMNALGLEGAHLDGILGYNLLARFAMDIDVSRLRMIWTRQAILPDDAPDLQAITGGKPVTLPKSMAQMDNMAGMMPKLMAKLKSETVARGFVGMELLPDKPGGRVQVARALADSPASRAGLQAGDVIEMAAMGTNPLQTVPRNADLLRLARELVAATPLRLQIRRNGATRTLTVRAGTGGL